MKIGLVVPVLNNFDQALDMIYSARSQHDIEVFVQPQYRYQVPLAQAFNKGIHQAMEKQCDYIIVANDDVLFGPSTIDDMVEEFEKDQNSSVILFPTDVHDEGTDSDEIMWRTELAEVEHTEDQVYSCFMVKPDFFERCGTFDENFDPAWWEDTDMKYRIHLLGLSKIYSKVPYLHLRHQTTQKLTKPLSSIKGQHYYQSKWGSCNRSLNETYSVPYNNSSLTPRDWSKL